MLDKSEIKPGIYKHYKGNEYEVIDVARHSETEELLVVYRPLYGERRLWVRPLAIFQERVELSVETALDKAAPDKITEKTKAASLEGWVDSVTVRRFQFIRGTDI